MRDHDTVPYSLPAFPAEDSIARARAMRDRLKQRRTCRYFSDEPAPRAVIEAAIEVAGTAPMVPITSHGISLPSHRPKPSASSARPPRKRNAASIREGDDPKSGGKRWVRWAPMRTSRFSKPRHG